MSHPNSSQALRDAIEMQSAATRFYGNLAANADDPAATKLLFDLARVEHLVVREIEAKTPQLTSAPLPKTASPTASAIKTACEWESFSLTEEQAMALALDCTTRAAYYDRVIAAELEGEAAAFFEALGTSEMQRANLLRNALRAQLEAIACERPLEQAFADTLVSVRRAAKRYKQLAIRAASARARTFLLGMVDVCLLHAAEIERNAVGLLGDVDLPIEEDHITDVAMPAPSEGDIDLETAMRLASDAQKRAALLHGMLAHAYPGDGAQLFYDIAEAERQHARTIASVLDRLFPRAATLPADDPASPLVDAPRRSWTSPSRMNAGEAPSMNMTAT